MTSRRWRCPLPLLTAADVTAIGSGKPEPGAPVAVLGPGTGLGVACLIASSKGPVIIPSEGGHATLVSTCERGDGIIRQLRRRFGHVSAERAISGNGLENIFQGHSLHWMDWTSDLEGRLKSQHRRLEVNVR